MELVYLPTYASWLNWIEPEFAALRYFVLGGTDHHTHAWQGEIIDRYMRWRNARAQPKTSFAPHSVIRTWTGYQSTLLDGALARSGSWRPAVPNTCPSSAC